jgi:hypothetical protein
MTSLGVFGRLVCFPVDNFIFWRSPEDVPAAVLQARSWCACCSDCLHSGFTFLRSEK